MWSSVCGRSECRASWEICQSVNPEKIDSICSLQRVSRRRISSSRFSSWLLPTLRSSASLASISAIGCSKSRYVLLIRRHWFQDAASSISPRSRHWPHVLKAPGLRASYLEWIDGNSLRRPVADRPGPERFQRAQSRWRALAQRFERQSKRARGPGLLHRIGPGGFRELVAAFVDDQRKVHPARHRRTQSFEDGLLAGTGVQEVAAPNDLGCPGGDIVDDHGELVGEQAVGSSNDEVAAGFPERVAQWSEYAVDHLDRCLRHAEAHASGGLARRNSVAAGARINAG